MSFSTLEIGKKALLAQRFGLEVTSNNIANANTKGFSRRDAQFSQTSPLYEYGQFVGSGVLAQKLRSFREDFFDREIRNTINRESGLTTDEKILDRVETVIAEPSEENLNESVTKFFRSFDELALKPESVGIRESVIELGKTVADKFNYISQGMLEAKKETYIDASALINEANRLIDQIASLNAAFSSNRNMTGEEELSLIDEREVKLENLSKLFKVNVTKDPDGTANVFINGMDVVTKTKSTNLKLEETIDPDTEEWHLKLTRVDKKGNFLSNLDPVSGEMASMIYHYNVTLDDKDTSGNFSAARRLNDFAQAITDNVNKVLSQGYGLDDTDPAAPGRRMFEISNTGPAMQMKVSDDLWNRPRDLPLSGRPGEPGNSEIARRVARLADKDDFIDGDDYTEYYAAFLGKLGSYSREVKDNLLNISKINETLQNQRESMIGVNMDEEAINLVKFQKAFEAASRIVSVTNEMMGTVINMGL